MAATLVGTVWQDLNSDGQQSGGEPAVQYAVAELFSSTNGTVGDSDDVSLGTRITDPAGNYQFTGLVAGVNHYVVIRPPVGFAFTVQDTGPDATDSDVSSTGVTAMFIPSGASVDLDAGLTGTTPAFGWAAALGSTDYEEGYSVAVDSAGNSFVTGRFRGAVDFDSGPGTYRLTSTGSHDVYVAKYTPVGALVWARRAGGTGGDIGRGVAVDASGNVLVTGGFQGTVDFDPGAEIANLTSSDGGVDAFVLKLDAAGNYLWARRVGGTSTVVVVGQGVAVDGSSSVLVTGYFWGTADFDPGAGTANRTSAGWEDAFVLKLDAAGNYVWAWRFGSNRGDLGHGVAVDAADNVLVTGAFEGTADFDPGASAANLTSAGNADVFVLKLDAAGSYVWAAQVGGTGSDYGYGVAVDTSGNVLVTGGFTGTVDFDPGAGVANLTAGGNLDVFAFKFDAAGNYQWARQIGGAGPGVGRGVAIDATGGLLLTGFFEGTFDFDPGPGTVNLTTVAQYAAFVMRLTSAGDYAWARRIGDGVDASGRAVAIDAAGNLLLTGDFDRTADFDPGLGMFELTSAGNSDGFVARWNAGQFVPEINLLGNGQSVASGDATPSAMDHTDFGPVLVNGGTLTRTFTVQNTGQSALRLTGTPRVLLSGAHAGDFAVTLQPTATINDGQSTTFEITFDPSAPGLRTATVTVLSDDSDEGAYTFAIQGVDDAGLLIGTVWQDTNADGQQILGELAVPYAVVELFTSANGILGDADDAWFGTQITNTNGNYQFADVVVGVNLYVVIRPPAGYGFTTPNTGPDATDSDVSATGVTAMFTRPAGATIDFDAGLMGAAPAFGWAAKQGNTGIDVGQSVTFDATGFTYVTGRFNGTTDFDSGPGTYNLTSAGSDDVYFAKHAPGGALVWARRVGGTSADSGLGVGLDTEGNILVTGYYQATADFDPGTGTTNLTSAGSLDVFLLKLDAAGNYVWAQRVGGTSADIGYGVVVDTAGNVVVTGQFGVAVDFDPGPGVINLTSAGLDDAFVLKLNAAGSFLWARRVGGGSSDQGRGLAVDASGNIAVSGFFEGTVDFDPGVGTASLTGAGLSDAFVLKLDTSGAYVWAARAGGTSSDFGYALTIDAGGNVLVTGQFRGTVDFDPGAGVATVDSAGLEDVFVLKLDAAGNYVWARNVGGTSTDVGRAIAADASGSVLITGQYQGTADFDPGAGIVSLTSAGLEDAFVLKLDSAGRFAWARSGGGASTDSGQGVAVDASGYVLVTGSFQSTVDFDPGAGTFNLTSAGGSDGFLWRFAPASFLPPTVTGVFVRGTGDGSGTGNDEWLVGYVAHLGAVGLGDAALGYRISVGADQLDTLPWTNVDTVSIRFSEGVTVTSGNLQVLGAAEGPAVPSVASFSYNASTFTATWQFATALPANKYLLYIATGVVVGLDTFALDGEWTDGVSTASGSGSAGGAFAFRMNVVPGDVNGDTTTTQSVTNADVLLTKQALSTDVSAGAAYLYRRDVNGSGAVTNADVLQAKQRLSTSIFDYTEPVPPPPGESFGDESFAAARLAGPWHTDALLDESAVAPSSMDAALAGPVAPEGTIDLEAWDAAILAMYGKKK